MQLLAQVNLGRYIGIGGSFSSIGSFASFIAKMAALATGFVAFAGIIYAAYLYLTSSGDPAKIKKANATFLYGILGLILVFAAYWIIQIFGGFLGVQAL